MGQSTKKSDKQVLLFLAAPDEKLPQSIFPSWDSLPNETTPIYLGMGPVTEGVKLSS